MKRSLKVLLGMLLVATIFGCSLFPFHAPTLPFIATSTPLNTLTPTPSPIPSPTPTPIPIARVESGDKALFDGDLDAARAQYNAAYQDTTDLDIRAAALWGLARVQAADGQHVETLDTLRQLINDFPQSPHVAQAYFLEGQTYFAMDRYDEAAAAYQNYLMLRPGVIDAYVLGLRGDALFAAKDFASALAAYESAQASPHLDDADTLQIKIAQSRAALNDYEDALGIYDTIATNTTNDYIKAQMDYLSGQVYLSMNRKEEAYGRFRHAVENYPLSYSSYLALIELVNAGAEVNDLDRGLTDYFAGQYDVALAAFDRFIAANPGNDGTAHYYRALSLEDLKDYQAAVDEFTFFIENFSTHSKWADAWDEKASIQWASLNLYEEAAGTLLDYVRAAPSSPQAPDALLYAARIYERDGRLDEAAQTWERVANEYPSNDQAPTAVFRAGLMRYRQQDYPTALTLFQRSLLLSSLAEDQARAYLWIGKVQGQLGKSGEMQAAWQQAQSTDPGGYYSERARDLLFGRPPFSLPALITYDVDQAAERKAADAWMRLTFNLPTETDLSGLGPLAADPRVVRGQELWDLGLYQDARLEFEDLRTSISTDPVLTYRLANHLIDIGLYRSGILAARQVLTLAGLDDHTSSMMAPPYFSHLRYGLYYADLILPASQSNGLNPLFLFSVVRQESLFEGFVRSAAGARGLMQIVPGTGANIANSIGWPLYYDPEQLYRPNVSIILGTHYLAANRDLLGGDLYAALAAYNGGPGNAVAWKQLSGDDPDLFLESTRFEETRQYIRNIYEIYIIYRRLYGHDT